MGGKPSPRWDRLRRLISGSAFDQVLAMGSSTTGSNKPSSAWLIIVPVLLLAVLVAAATWFLGNPWFAVAHLAVYAAFLVSVVVQLRRCLRLAKAREHVLRLRLVGLLLGTTVIVVLKHIMDMLHSGNENYISVATDLGVYFALLTSLQLVQILLTALPDKANKETT
jgi:hypothetical protein